MDDGDANAEPAKAYVKALEESIAPWTSWLPCRSSRSTLPS